MKKKARRFDEGGSVEQRAKFFAALADKPEEQAAFQRRIHEQQQAKAEASDRERAGTTSAAPRDAAAPKSAAAPKPTASSSSPAPAPSTRVSMGSQNEATYTPRGKFTDSDAESRAARQSEADDENVRRIQRARDEADNSERISRAGVSTSSQNDADDKPSASRYPGQYSPERRAARLQRSAENADRGGMTPQAEKAVDAAMTAASVVPAARVGLGAARVGKEVATAAAQQARTRAGLGRQFGESAEDAARVTAGAPRTTARDVAAGAREVAARRIEAAKSPAKRAEELRRARGEGMEPMDTGITMPPTVRERAAEAARSAVESGRRLYNKMKPEPKLVRGRGRNFAESADDAAQKGYKKGGKVSASSRADGIAQRGKTRGRYL